MDVKRQTFTAPGRVEICGNHTDHQHGRVLAAAIDLPVTCEARPNGTNAVNADAEGFGAFTVSLDDLRPREDEKGTTAALIRGVAAWLNERGRGIGGFDAHIKSAVPPGAGLSSSAAFEIVMADVFDGLFGSSPLSRRDAALAGQYAENVFFGKPCGLLDQCTSAFGGLITVDFARPENFVVTPIKADFGPYSMCVVQTGGSHADLTPDYAAIPAEMSQVAQFFGKNFLRDVPADDFFAHISDIRALAGDRAVLRAIHFFGENERVSEQAAALQNGDFGRFLALVSESGYSSSTCLQNIYSVSNPREQGLSTALALSARILGADGACRVHGGGFAGTILAFVPEHLKDTYKKQMSAVYGENSCIFLNIYTR